jgi:hypothetical protein
MPAVNFLMEDENMSSLLSHIELSERISKNLQRLEDILPEDTRTDLVVPRGIIRRVEDLLPEYDFIMNNTIQRNICYAVEALDFYRWIINRFKTYAPVSGYLYKTGIILADMIVEAMTRDFLKQRGVKQNKKHSKNIAKLKTLGVPTSLRERIEKLHSRRSNIHLYLISDLEATKYKLKDWNSSILCLHHVREKFRELLSNNN